MHHLMEKNLDLKICKIIVIEKIDRIWKKFCMKLNKTEYIMLLYN